jgi:hypothetical protein
LNNLGFSQLHLIRREVPDGLNDHAAQDVEHKRGAGALAQVPGWVDRTDLLAM